MKENTYGIRVRSERLRTNAMTWNPFAYSRIVDLAADIHRQGGQVEWAGPESPYMLVECSSIDASEGIPLHHYMTTGALRFRQKDGTAVYPHLIEGSIFNCFNAAKTLSKEFSRRVFTHRMWLMLITHLLDEEILWKNAGETEIVLVAKKWLEAKDLYDFDWRTR